MIQISPDKVAQVIVRAREFDAKTGRWDSPGDSKESDTILESRSSDATEQEVRAFIATLNRDEQASLVAIMWIGRGSFDAVELDEALATARESAITPTEDYLMGVPLLSDYLEGGLDALGYSVEEAEEGIL